MQQEKCDELLEEIRKKYTQKDQNFEQFFKTKGSTNLSKTVSMENVLKFKIFNSLSAHNLPVLYFISSLIEVFGVKEEITLLWHMVTLDSFSTFIEALRKGKFKKGMTFFIHNTKIPIPLVLGMASLIEKFWLQEDMTLSLHFNKIWDYELSVLAKAIAKHWLKRWVCLWLGTNNIGKDWMTQLSDTLRQAGLEEDVEIDLRNNQIWDEWMSAFAKMLWFRWFKKWLKLNVENNQISTLGMKYFAAAVRRRWLEEWMNLDFSVNPNIWDVWIWYLSDAISKNWFPEGVVLRLANTGITDVWAQYLLDLIQRVKLKKGLVIDLQHNAIESPMQQMLKAEAVAQGFKAWEVFKF